MSIQQMFLGVGAVATKTYVDDVFSTYVYKGNESARAINNGINLSGKGGLVWVKSRNDTHDHHLVDTVRGANDILESNTSDAEATVANRITGFNSNGFNLGSAGQVNGTSAYDYSSWTFRKAPGFFDVVTWTGNSSTTQVISHSLGSLPGCIMAKCTSDTGNWAVYHRSLDGGNQPATHYLRLNTTNAEIDDDNKYADTEPTATNFTAGLELNENNKTYVAYVFAGGESEAATARSVDFNSGDNEYLSIASDAAFQFGTGDFTVEFWWRGGEGSGNYQQVIGTQSVYNPDSGIFRIGTRTNANKVYFSSPDGSGFDEPVWDVNVNDNQWHHIAITRASGYVYCYIDGIIRKNVGESNNITRSLTTSNSLYIGRNGRDGSYIDGQLSNVRIVKGTAVYTSSFKPSTAPLTNITNTTLLCCNDSSTTGKTVGPTITANNSPTAKTDSPFDDPAGFVFGENEDKNVIKTGSYVGDGNGGSNQGVANSQEIFLGWEPQWILIKRSSAAESWILYDSMRGISNVSADSADAKFEINFNDAESLLNHINLTSTGFTFTTGNNQVNADGNDYVFVAIRRSDGYVGKPAEAGTDVFDIEFGSGGSAEPAFIGGFPVGFAINRELYSSGTTNPVSAGYYTGARLTGQTRLSTHDNSVEATSVTDWIFDSNTGWSKNYPNNYISWMWKRHAGFDVVAYKGNGVGKNDGGHQIAHSMNKTPEMIWVKRRDGSTAHWAVYHKGLNGGTNPQNYSLKLNTTAAEDGNSSEFWADTAPTSTHFTVGDTDAVNNSSSNYIAMLFASVPTISAVGYYDGDATNNINLTSQLDFTPRFFMCKSTTASTGWLVVDKTRDTNMGKRLFLNSTAAETSYDAVFAMSKYLESNKTGLSVGGEKYIFYAHA
jgi:hypothetical protein